VEQLSLGGAVPLADDQRQPAAGEVVQSGVVLEGTHRVEQAQRGDPGPQLDPRGAGGDVAEHDRRRGGDERALVTLADREPVEAGLLGQHRGVDDLAQPPRGRPRRVGVRDQSEEQELHAGASGPRDT
jgi:hypothetical protein